MATEPGDTGAWITPMNADLAHARQSDERHGFVAIAFTDGQANEERCPEVLSELLARGQA